MNAKKLATILLFLGAVMTVAGTSSADVVSFSDDVSFDHDEVITMMIFSDLGQLDYTFFSDTVQLPKFDLGTGLLNSVTLTVESDITVDTYFYFDYNYYQTDMWWYSAVDGTANGLQVTSSQAHNHVHGGQGYFNHTFPIDGAASESTSSDLADFIGEGLVDVAITGDDKLRAWWNPYWHFDTDTYGTVTATLSYDYIPVYVDILPAVFPNMFKVKTKGPLEVAILGTAEFDVTQVDPASVTLEEVSPLSWVQKDVGTPGSPTEGPDGIMDLTFKFSTPEVADALGHVQHGDLLELLLIGNVLDGRVFGGTDEVYIVKKGKE